ncbi:MAG: preprotein translocase subunit SecG [Patescibacteria group bacterium]
MISVILPYIQDIQVFLSVLLIAGVLLQRSEAGLGAAFGGDSSNMRFTRRGFEKLLFRATCVVAVLFVLAAFASLILSR